MTMPCCLFKCKREWRTVRVTVKVVIEAMLITFSVLVGFFSKGHLIQFKFKYLLPRHNIYFLKQCPEVIVEYLFPFNRPSYLISHLILIVPQSLNRHKMSWPKMQSISHFDYKKFYIQSICSVHRIQCIVDYYRVICYRLNHQHYKRLTELTWFSPATK